MQSVLFHRCHFAACSHFKATKELTRQSTTRNAAESRQGGRHIASAVASRPKTVQLLEQLMKEDEHDREDEDEEFDDLDSPDEPSALSTQQVQNLINVVCQDTEVAEIELQTGGFELKLRRKIGGAQMSQILESSAAGAAPAPYIEQAFQSTASIDESQISSQQPSNNGHMSSTDEDDHDENLIFLGAPKVGVLRRNRFVKGKKVGKGPLVEVGARVKKGQLLAFIEQLGTHVPVEAPQAGEIVSFECDEGSAVEYKEVIIEMAPFFGGHIIGDRKYA